MLKELKNKMNKIELFRYIVDYSELEEAIAELKQLHTKSLQLKNRSCKNYKHWGDSEYKNDSHYDECEEIETLAKAITNFKVDDWVRYKASYTLNRKPFKIEKIENSIITTTSGKEIWESAVEKWYPQEGEICIFEKYDLEYPIIARCTEKLKAESINWEPYTGEPTNFIKDKE